MRRVTTYCMDVAIGDEGRLYVLCRDDGQGGSIRRTNWDDEDLGTIGGSGRGDGQFSGRCRSCATGRRTSSSRTRACTGSPSSPRDGTFLGKWGEQGAGPGQLNRPSGIAFDADENLYVADTQNHRVQQFTRDGQHLDAFGTPGQGQGELEHALGRGGGRGRGRLRRGLGQRPHPEVQPPGGTSCCSSGAPGASPGSSADRPAWRWTRTGTSTSPTGATTACSSSTTPGATWRSSSATPPSRAAGAPTSWPTPRSCGRAR